ncbi:HAMP domain-containing histidine kinase [Salipaludibacillus sp. CUR1]|uniref:sensor histidine kinase n=1 Tax=Salipaludibacillus sp. CUR1 TaxID=2820003 RepID=UPI001E2F16F7|nr:HAMP domain-containing sensor histidine kinase [Salipaludibacillus sp. CUR1]MCE7791328.1 HAMP domain-containing histidine kinase [Salipaludibacillus sp. CUR1]
MIKTGNIFKKLFLSYSLIIFLSFVLFGLVFIYLFHINLYEEYEETYTHHYNQVKNHLELQSLYGWNNEETAASLESALNQKGFSIIVYNSDGAPIYVPDDTVTAVNGIDAELIRAAVAGNMVSEGTRIDGSLSYLIASPLTVSMTDESFTMAMIFYDLDHEYRQMVFMILITFTITIAFAGVILWFISRKITAPLRDMNNIAMKYAKGDFTHTVNVASNDEIGQLGQTFNYMADELNSLEQMRKDFIANVSHDLRSPLTSIKGFLVALLDGTIPDKKRDHYYLLMKDETERVIKLVNDTLDMTQLESGKIKLEQENYNLQRQLQRIVVKLEPQLTKKNIELEIISDDKDIYVFADPARIEQALINLLQNAIQFSAGKAKVTIFLEKNKDEASIRIEDTGKGIAQEELALIWERFYKADRSRTDKAGTGIGLSIVKSIMDLHGVPIHVESQLGKGTTFSFTLPLGKNKDD